MQRPRDTDYLYLSSRLKALERNMLSREKLGRLISARSGEEVAKLLMENGWADCNPEDPVSLERAIDAQREEMFALLDRYAPDRAVVDVFRLPYDGHNLKVLIKAQALDLHADDLLSNTGTIPKVKLQTALREKTYHTLPDAMRDAAVEAIDLLARTRDPQLCDVVLDRAITAQQLALAQQSGSTFLIDYLRLSIDLCNLRVVTRAARCGKGTDYLKRAVFPGGTVLPDRLWGEATPDSVRERFAGSALSAAAEAAAQALGGDADLARLDLECDNARISALRSARFTAFGVPQVVAYVVSRESERIAVRMIMAGRIAGLSEEQMIERLRSSHV